MKNIVTLEKNQMKRKTFIFLFIWSFFFGSTAWANNDWPKNPYHKEFSNAYQKFPDVPKGILEAISFSQTRFYNIIPLQTEPGCNGIPLPEGVMGLFRNGKNYFRENAKRVEELSGLPYHTDNVKNQIESYASAFSKIAAQRGINSENPADYVPVLIELSELPLSNDLQNDFALNSYLYQIFWLLNHPSFQANYQTPHYRIDLKRIFGSQNLAVLSSSWVMMETENIYTTDGITYDPSQSVLNVDYPGAIWNPTTCNYSSRNGTAITAITIHTVQGSYSGCISWFKNCSANVSAHYVIRSSDGQITQMVREIDKAWHVGSENPYTIGYEHEGYVNNASWYTTAMYNSSANITKNICTRRNINPIRTAFWPWAPTTNYNNTNTPGSCVRIKGHQHYPNQTHTDPGANWNWDLYFKLVNPNPTVNTYTTATGSFTDPGGASANYGNDQRVVYTISPANATAVTVTFNSFNLENRWDYLYIYDGPNISSPLIGTYTGTTSPGTVTSSGGSITFEFRSDCATTAAGWEAVWSSQNSNSNPNPPADNVNPTTSINATGNWVSSNFSANFTDTDNTGGSGIDKGFYQVLEYNGYEYRANNSNGFFSDNFDSIIHPDWTIKTGNWLIENGYLRQKDTTLSNTNIYAYLRQDLSNRYLYNWAQKFLGVSYTGANRRAGFHFMADSPDSSNRGNSYFVWFRLDNDKIQIYKVVNNSWGSGPVVDVAYNFNPNYWYDVKVVYDRITGKMNVYLDNVLSATYTDPNPHQTGNYISFRTGNSDYLVNNLKVYRSRHINQATTIKVGPASTNDIRYQNANPNIPAGKIKSITSDNAGNLSSVAYWDVNVDWTAPNPPSVINDGVGFDQDTTYLTTELFGNWSQVTDPNSGFRRFWYSIGTSAGDTSVVGWTDHWIYDTLYVDSLNLTVGQRYYINVKAENNAGLISNVGSSDGILVVANVTGQKFLVNEKTFKVFPTPVEDKLFLYSPIDGRAKIELYSSQGAIVKSHELNLVKGQQPIFDFQELGISAGGYYVKVVGNDFSKSFKIIKP